MNKEISEIFGEIIKLLEIKGDKALNFKIRAYKNAIYILNELKVDISEIYKTGGLKAIRELGIGERNAKKIEEYIKTGKIKEYEKLKKALPIIYFCGTTPQYLESYEYCLLSPKTKYWSFVNVTFISPTVCKLFGKYFSSRMVVFPSLIISTFPFAIQQ